MTVYNEITTASGLALDSIRAHKLRSFLTLLGVIIGVASVVLVGAAVDGLGVYAEGITSKAFGTDSYLVAQIAAVGRLIAEGVCREAAEEQADSARRCDLPARGDRIGHHLQPVQRNSSRT